MNEWKVTLVTEAQGGNSKCFEELYELYHKKVYAVIKTTVRNSADAEDILQQTFLNAWRKLSTLTDPAAFNTWIQRIAMNECYALLRKKNVAILLDSEEAIDSISEETADEGLIPAVYAEREDLRVRLGKIIDGLSEVQRQTITLFYFNELKVEEIAEIMECSVNTVKTRLFLARKAIRSEIEEQERKSGEKFYGIAGIPLLGLSEVLARQTEDLALSQAASSGILESISSAIAADAIAAAGTAAGAGAAAAVGATGKAGVPLAVKILAGAAAAAVIATSALVIPRLMTSSPGEAETPTPSPVTDVAVQMPDTDTDSTTASEAPAEEDYYDTLSDGQKTVLSQLETALKASDYETAYGIQKGSEFHTLCDAIPEHDGRQSFWYYPNNEISVQVFISDDGGKNMRVFTGSNGSGILYGSRYGGSRFENYVMGITNYSGSVPNGPFTQVILNYTEENAIFHIQRGNLLNGEANGPFYYDVDGELQEYEYDPDWYNSWATWPEKLE